jgi:hypothetical protein
MFIIIYNAHTNDVEWITHYFGGLLWSFIFGIMGLIFAGSGLYDWIERSNWKRQTYCLMLVGQK